MSDAPNAVAGTSQVPHGTKRQSLTLRQLCDIYAVVMTAAIAAA